MKVLMISSDRRMFEAGSAVRARHAAYGSMFEELHIIVFSTGAHGTANVFDKIGENVWVYPTRSKSRLLYVLDAWLLARRFFRREGAFDVISVQDPFEAGCAGFLIARYFQKPLHIQVHTDFLSPFFTAKGWLPRLRVWVAKRLLPRAARVRVVSDTLQKMLIQRFPALEGKVDVLPVFVDVERFRDAPALRDARKEYPQFSQTILMLSRLTPEKNIGFALELLPTLLQTFPRLGLIIVGDGPEQPRLALRARDLDIQFNVVFEPWTEDPASFYKMADLFLFTSVYEGHGMTLVEAAASGIPIVCSAVGVASVLGNFPGVHVCPINDDACFLDALTRELKDGRRVYERTELFEDMSWARYLERYHATLERALSHVER